MNNLWTLYLGSSPFSKERNRLIAPHSLYVLFQFLNQSIDFHEIWYECYATGGHLHPRLLLIYYNW
jgi:hypothetical protein